MASNSWLDYAIEYPENNVNEQQKTSWMDYAVEYPEQKQTESNAKSSWMDYAVPYESQQTFIDKPVQKVNNNTYATGTTAMPKPIEQKPVMHDRQYEDRFNNRTKGDFVGNATKDAKDVLDGITSILGGATKFAITRPFANLTNGDKNKTLKEKFFTGEGKEDLKNLKNNFLPAVKEGLKEGYGQKGIDVINFERIKKGESPIKLDFKGLQESFDAHPINYLDVIGLGEVGKIKPISKAIGAGKEIPLNRKVGRAEIANPVRSNNVVINAIERIAEQPAIQKAINKIDSIPGMSNVNHVISSFLGRNMKSPFIGNKTREKMFITDKQRKMSKLNEVEIAKAQRENYENLKDYTDEQGAEIIRRAETGEILPANKALYEDDVVKVYDNLQQEKAINNQKPLESSTTNDNVPEYVNAPKEDLSHVKTAENHVTENVDNIPEDLEKYVIKPTDEVDKTNNKFFQKPIKEEPKVDMPVQDKIIKLEPGKAETEEWGRKVELDNPAERELYDEGLTLPKEKDLYDLEVGAKATNPTAKFIEDYSSAKPIQQRKLINAKMKTKEGAEQFIKELYDETINHEFDNPAFEKIIEDVTSAYNRQWKDVPKAKTFKDNIGNLTNVENARVNTVFKGSTGHIAKDSAHRKQILSSLIKDKNDYQKYKARFNAGTSKEPRAVELLKQELKEVGIEKGFFPNLKKASEVTKEVSNKVETRPIYYNGKKIADKSSDAYSFMDKVRIFGRQLSGKKQTNLTSVHELSKNYFKNVDDLFEGSDDVIVKTDTKLENKIKGRYSNKKDIIYINPRIYKKMTKAEQAELIAHEFEHAKQNRTYKKYIKELEHPERLTETQKKEYLQYIDDYEDCLAINQQLAEFRDKYSNEYDTISKAIKNKTRNINELDKKEKEIYNLGQEIIQEYENTLFETNARKSGEIARGRVEGNGRINKGRTRITEQKDSSYRTTTKRNRRNDRKKPFFGGRQLGVPKQELDDSVYSLIEPKDTELVHKLFEENISNGRDYLEKISKEAEDYKIKSGKLNRNRADNLIVEQYASRKFNKKFEDLTKEDKLQAFSEVMAIGMKEGNKSPFYVPHKSKEQLLDLGDLFESKSYKNSPSELAKVRSKATKDNLETNINKIADQLSSEAIRIKNSIDLVDSVKHAFGEAVDLTRKDSGIKEGYVGVNTKALYQAFVNNWSKSEMIETLQRDANLLEELIGKDITKLYEDLTKYDCQIPRHIYDQLFFGQGKTTKVEKALEFGNDNFKRGVLGLSPKWFINNRIGNAVMMGLKGVNASHVIRALYKDDKYFPEEILGNNILESVKGITTKKYYTGNTAVDAWLDVLGGKTIKTSKLRGAEKAKAVAINTLAIPGKVVNKLTNTMFAFNQKFENLERKATYLKYFDKQSKAIRKNVGQNIVKQNTLLMEEALKNKNVRELLVENVEQTLGDYISMTPAERRFLKQVIPFYSWFRTISRYAYSLPTKDPIRLSLANKLGRIADAENLDDDDLKDYQKGARDSGLVDERTGKHLMLNFSHANPLSTFFETSDNPIGVVSPFITNALEAYNGKKFFLDTPLSSKKYISKYDGGKRKYYDIEKKEFVEQLPASEKLKYYGLSTLRNINPMLKGIERGSGYISNKLSANNPDKSQGGEWMPYDKLYDTSLGGFNVGDKNRKYGKSYSKKSQFLRSVLPLQEADYKKKR